MLPDDEAGTERLPTRLELHSGLVLGDDPAALARRRKTEQEATDAGPREILEHLVAEVLRAGPCAVRFSGGRDSSLVLAVAVAVARREGHPLPKAVVVRYPGTPGAEESSWQDLVLDHLDVPAEVIEVDLGSDEIAGAFGVAQLRRGGPFMPPTSGVSLARITPAVVGHTVLSGQGGDEVLGESRISSFVAHWRRRRVPTPTATAWMLHDLMPRAARRRIARREVRTDDPAPWLTPQARARLVHELLDTMTEGPWDWREARWITTSSRQWAVGSASLARVAAREGFTLADPLLDPRFVHAMCLRGGRTGLATRTEAMRVLAEDLLPLKLLRRATKATFENAYAGRRTHEFARAWDGSGVDHDLVDVERLRAAWLSDPVPGMSLAPLQLALLEAVRRGWEPPVDERFSA